MSTNPMPPESYSKFRDLGKAFAAEIKRPPTSMSFIEARGYMCHELTYLLGGRVTFTETPIMSFVIKTLEYFLPIMPICRWTPPINSTLEQIGFHKYNETTVYRLKQESDVTVVFIVEYKPEAPAFGPYVRSLFNTPQLVSNKFLRPPFTKENINEIEHVFRGGMVGTFTPIPMTDDAYDYMKISRIELHNAMWEEFCGD